MAQQTHSQKSPCDVQGKEHGAMRMKRGDFFKRSSRERDALNNAQRKKRAKAELQRAFRHDRDLSSPFGWGPVWEGLSSQRHVTRDPGDQSAGPHEKHFNPFDPSKKGPWEP
jgi:hypothetical protein